MQPVNIVAIATVLVFVIGAIIMLVKKKNETTEVEFPPVHPFETIDPNNYEYFLADVYHSSECDKEPSETGVKVTIDKQDLPGSIGSFYRAAGSSNYIYKLTAKSNNEGSSLLLENKPFLHCEAAAAEKF
jgi:hypothetical protein